MDGKAPEYPLKKNCGSWLLPTYRTVLRFNPNCEIIGKSVGLECPRSWPCDKNSGATTLYGRSRDSRGLKQDRGRVSHACVMQCIVTMSNGSSDSVLSSGRHADIFSDIIWPWAQEGQEKYRVQRRLFQSLVETNCPIFHPGRSPLASQNFCFLVCKIGVCSRTVRASPVCCRPFPGSAQLCLHAHREGRFSSLQRGTNQGPRGAVKQTPRLPRAPICGYKGKYLECR